MLRLVGVLESAHSGAGTVPLRVVMHAAAAMVNVTELDADEVPREQLDTHLPRFMHALEQLIGSSLPKARAFTSLSLLFVLLTSLYCITEHR